MRILAVAAGGLIGGVLGYFIGVYIACDWLYPTSNLCGIYGVFATGPIGMVIGVTVGWLLSKPKAIKPLP
jgi:hypothetical protein